MKYCSRSIPLRTLQLMLQLTLQLTLRQMLQPMPPTTSPIMQLMLPTSRETPSQTQGIMKELNLRQCRLITQKAVSVNTQETKWR
jgi:hypothetical protein